MGKKTTRLNRRTARKGGWYYEAKVPKERIFNHSRMVFWLCVLASVLFAAHSLSCQYAFNAAVGNSILFSVGVGVATLICVAVLYIAIMMLYTKRAFSSAQKALLVAGVLLASFIVRFVVAVLTTIEVTETGIESDGDISASFVSALYSAFGGLTFEGMDGELSIAVWQAAVYHGVAILAAVVFFSSATLALDYPIASEAAKIAVKFKSKFTSFFRALFHCDRRSGWWVNYKNGKPDVYIFDSITQDSVLLAEDIRRSYENSRAERKKNKRFILEHDGRADEQFSLSAFLHRKHEVEVMSAFRHSSGYDAALLSPDGNIQSMPDASGKREIKRVVSCYRADEIAWTKGRSCVIVFCGPECDAYDRKNSLHRRIEANNFLYLRYNFGKDIPIARVRKMSTAGYGVVRTWLQTARNIHFFAFSRDESFEEKSGRKYRSEQANAQSVSDELDAIGFRIKGAYAKKNRCRLHKNNHSESARSGLKKLWRARWAERVCFYVLSENDIDYSTYQARLSASAGEIARYVDMVVDLKIVNEAERATWHHSLTLDHGLSDLIAEQYAHAAAKINNAVRNEHSWDSRCCSLVGAESGDALAKAACGIFGWNNPNDTQKKLLESLKSAVCSSRLNSADEARESVIKIVSEHFSDVAVAADKVEELKKFAGHIPEDCMMAVSLAQAADDSITNSRERRVVRILSLGFGDTARKTIGSLYINNDGNMIVDAFDTNADNIMGAYRRTHPSVLCMPAEEGGNIVFGDLFGAVKEGKRVGALEPPPGAAADYVKNRHKKAFDYDNLLAINYASRDCLSAAVADYIDICFGRTRNEATKYDAMIIALGNDESNIACFRSIIMDIRHELICNPSAKTLPNTIFVHIGDEKNAARLFWEDSQDKTSDTGFLKDMRIVPYGFKQDVYTFDEIINDCDALSMNYWYLKKAAFLPQGHLSNQYSEWRRIGDPTIYKKWSSKVAVTFFEKLCALESTVAAALLSPASQVTPGSKLSLGDAECAIKTLSAATEHRRWSRFHYVNGYELYGEGNSLPISKQAKERNLVHNMLKRFAELTLSQQKNNHANGAQAAEWENEHLVEECLQSPSRNLSETEMAFVTARLETELNGIAAGGNFNNSFMDGLIRACSEAYCGNAEWSALAERYGIVQNADINIWLSANGALKKYSLLRCLLDTDQDEKWSECELLAAELGRLSPIEVNASIENRAFTSNDNMAVGEYRYELLMRLFENVMTERSGKTASGTDHKKIKNLNDIIRKAIPVELVTLLKRGQLSQEFVCKSGDYENFGAAVRMPDGVTITRREELLRLYYIWKKRKKSD